MIAKRCRILILAATAATLCGVNPIAAKEPALAIYLLDDAEAVRRVRTTPLDELHLSDSPLLTEADVVTYDWATHTIQISDAAMKRLPRPSVHGEPFVVVADGKRIYVGALFTSSSSVSHAGPVIVVDPIREGRPPEGCIRIDAAYPSDRFLKGKDVRQDPRVSACLKRLGKQKKPIPPRISETEARKLASREYIELSERNILAQEIVTVIGKHTLDFDVPGFAKRGEQVWEAHATKLAAALRGVLWIHTSSGEVKGIIGHWNKQDAPGEGVSP